MGLAKRSCASHPPTAGGRRIDRMERLNHVVFGKSDADRHRKVHKNQHGAWRQCPACGAQARRKRWTRVGRPPGRVTPVGAHALEWTLCEGCARVRQGRIDGVLTMSGIGERDREELANLIRNVAVEAWHDDPVHRILDSKSEHDELVIETTSTWLAETLGKAIRRRFGGSLDIRWSPGSDFARLHWAAPSGCKQHACGTCGRGRRPGRLRT
ncbi:MAG: hypothetical protein VKO64_01470 [Candidatus Sericytochromatia bacterium]|nr:hypothetical protein [Candidatus Sericytochromatia bacterium]